MPPNPSCKQSDPFYPKIVDGIKNLLLQRGECTPNLFIETYPDIAAKFAPKSLKNQITRTKKVLLKQLSSQGVRLPHGPPVAAQTTPDKTGKSCMLL